MPVLAWRILAYLVFVFLAIDVSFKPEKRVPVSLFIGILVFGIYCVYKVKTYIEPKYLKYEFRYF